MALPADPLGTASTVGTLADGTRSFVSNSLEAAVVLPTRKISCSNLFRLGMASRIPKGSKRGGVVASATTMAVMPSRGSK